MESFLEGLMYILRYELFVVRIAKIWLINYCIFFLDIPLSLATRVNKSARLILNLVNGGALLGKLLFMFSSLSFAVSFSL